MRNRLFYSLFGLALIVRVVEDLLAGLPRVYAGELFPWRHFPGIPLAPLWLAIAMWSLQVVIGALFLLKPKSQRLLATGTFITVLFSLTQMFQNQRLLMLAVSFLLILGDSVDVRKALKWQIIIVYLFSFLHKMEAQFWNGDVIRSFALLLAPHSTSPFRIYALNWASRFSEFASVATLVAEVSLPIALIVKPRAGFALVVLLHAAFAVVMPDIVSFGLTMAALASLYFEDQPSNSALRA